MSPGFFTTARWRYMPALARSAAVLLFIAGLAVVFYAQHSYRENRVGTLAVQARILAATVSAALSFGDRTAAGEYVDALEADPTVRAVAVYALNGTLFASFVRDKAASLPATLRPGGAVKETSGYIATAPVTQDGEVLGTVYVEAVAEPLALLVQRYSAIVLLAIMASLVIGVLAAAQAALTRANEELAARAAELSQTNAELERQITERERAEESLRQAQKMDAIGQLTGGIAHDFNNILQVIVGNLELLQKDATFENKNFARLLDRVRRAADRATALTSQMLAFARRQPLAPRAADVNKLVGGMSNLLHRTLGESLSIETVLGAGLWRVSADTNQLESALLNLAVNARDAMPRGGKLTIETQNAYLDEAYSALNERITPGQYVMIAVTDTGTGMSKEVIAKAFDPFFTTKDVGRGTGLGLSQVYGFVKQSGGHVTIYSEVGQGTTVKIYLPRLLAVEAEPEPAAGSQAIPRADKQELVLVVEDDEDVRANSADMLRALGYAVLEAADGHEALRLLETEPNTRLLFTDVGLPGGLNGRQLADEARRRHPDLPVLFTTGYARNAIVHHGRLDPGIELIGKPFTQAVLAAKLRQVLGDRAADEGSDTP
jgi:signal transduction histidine kinase/ActR/RegA family two-component response regulator